jgi:anaerobic C4-dicarboxylate transporter
MMTMSKTIVVAVIVAMCFTNASMAQSDEETQQRLSDVEQRLSAQERALDSLKEEGGIAFIVLFLFGLVLSMWAINRQRSGCGWFILGFIPVVNMIAGLVALLAENKRRKSGPQQE